MKLKRQKKNEESFENKDLLFQPFAYKIDSESIKRHKRNRILNIIKKIILCAASIEVFIIIYRLVPNIIK